MQNLKTIARQALNLMDLTSLNDNDTTEVINKLCQNAKTAHGHPAAVCVYPAFIADARRALSEQGISKVQIATVTNFPTGAADVALAEGETKAAIAAGADEVDVVFPWRALQTGDTQIGYDLVAACKAACGDKLLKVIIESGELKTPELIRQASLIAIDAGADFIKTSTGKVSINATPEAAEIMLGVIAEKGGRCGFKAAGGVRSAEEAQVYLAIAARLLGEAWITPAHFRFGASSLLASLLATLDDKQSAISQNGY
ncbi:deoxyribose-phosphate aldolase [Limnobaculum zhutongyuii]|uniref:Deoxyribose-phosphate aldolase n=1 Tax=Limnobaculum zhutongyuii TaxID=2498113 RepID=A0A411WKK2_9GAMM|nr:deoxyribose-phosphate aldolase [Limnobaculum zhutongyuii]QBH96754.1 deoxyribose-phosphate aldolase [Limnobaculum zhutongyuii]TQS90215.1 deoxyribose-phosphate aldolase [Limnobaculum zhutongyuii]